MKMKSKGPGRFVCDAVKIPVKIQIIVLDIENGYTSEPARVRSGLRGHLDQGPGDQGRPDLRSRRQ